MTDYEAQVEAAYTAILRAGDTAIDVGAHTGRHTIPMARAVGETGSVLAFEPLRRAREHLVQSIAELRNTRENIAPVRVFPYALARSAGTSSFVVVNELPEYSGLRERVYDSAVTTRTIDVPVETLDHMAADLANLAVIKIDTEGGEFDVIAGGVATLRRTGPVVLFEMGDNSLLHYEATSADMHDLLGSLDYRVYDILGRALDRTQFVESSAVQHVWDYVAVRAETPNLPWFLTNSG